MLVKRPTRMISAAACRAFHGAAAGVGAAIKQTTRRDTPPARSRRGAASSRVSLTHSLARKKRCEVTNRNLVCAFLFLFWQGPRGRCRQRAAAFLLTPPGLHSQLSRARIPLPPRQPPACATLTALLLARRAQRPPRWLALPAAAQNLKTGFCTAGRRRRRNGGHVRSGPPDRAAAPLRVHQGGGGQSALRKGSRDPRRGVQRAEGGRASHGARRSARAAGCGAGAWGARPRRDGRKKAGACESARAQQPGGLRLAALAREGRTRSPLQPALRARSGGSCSCGTCRRAESRDVAPDLPAHLALFSLYQACATPSCGCRSAATSTASSTT